MKSNAHIKQFILFILAGTGCTMQVNAQQLGGYLQYQQHTEQINPAYSLASDQAKFYTVGRKQWMGVDGAPTTILAGGHIKTGNERSSVGFNVLYDKIGPERYTEANAYYGYSLKLSEKDFLGATVGLGLRWYQARTSLIEGYDQALRADINERVGTFGLSFLYYRKDQFYVGATLPRLGGEQFEDVQIFREDYSFTGGYLFEVDPGLHIKANTWVSVMQDQDVLINFSAMAYFNRKFGIGANYMNTRNLGVLASFAVNNKLKFGYGYQFGVGNTMMASPGNGTHEISLSYHFSKGGGLRLL